MKIVGVKHVVREIELVSSHSNVLPHILFVGPRGSGKTTLARYSASLSKKAPKELSAATLTIQSLLTTLVNLKRGDVVFIDEIHRLPARLEEILYKPIEESRLIVEDTMGRTHNLQLPLFTLIGATTSPSQLSKPLLSRFKMMFEIPLYSIKELAQIVLLNFPQYTRKEAVRIAGNIFTPREAINLALRVHNLKQASKMTVVETLNFLGYKRRLSARERQYVRVVNQLGRASLVTMSSILQMDDKETRRIEERLLHLGLIEISSRGRRLTVKGLVEVKHF